jgi:predicted NBD/HSP70 family sugar kinase
VIGEKLGKAMASLINIFNPELVILGGLLSTTNDYLRLPIKSSLNKYSSSLVNNDTPLKTSKLALSAGIMGACLLVRNSILQ